MRMRPRISYLLAGFGSTGGSMVLYRLMDKLSERGYTVFAITPTERVQWQVNYSRRVVERLARSQSTLYGYARKILPRPARELLKLLHSTRVTSLQRVIRGLVQNWTESEVTISTYFTTAYAGYAVMDKTSALYHMQHYEELFFDDQISRMVARLTYYLPLALIANSTWLQNEVRQRIGRDSYLLHPGIDTQVFYPRVDIQKKYKDLNKVCIVSYCSPRRFKAWEDAVETMRILFKELGHHRLEWTVFGGIPRSRPPVPVKFVGKVFTDSLAELYSRAHVVFMNSWYESFPLPPLEAMACGTAVVTTQIGTEDYAVDGENSLVTPPRQPELLADAITKLVERPSLACQFAEKGSETAKSFTWDRATDCLEEIIQKAIPNHRRNRFADIARLVSGNFPFEKVTW